MWVCSTGVSIAALSFLGLDAHVLEDGLDRSLGFFVGVSGPEPPPRPTGGSGTLRVPALSVDENYFTPGPAMREPTTNPLRAAPSAKPRYFRHRRKGGNMRRLLIVLTALLLLVVAAVPGVSAKAAGPKPDYFLDESKLPFDPLPGLSASQYWGVHGGAGYRVEVPDNWNGDLVVWAHGFRGDGLELTVDNHPLRPLLLQLGYAWAASSYSTNSYDVAQGVKDTHALTKLFNGLVGNPDITYLTGASMGGHITAAAIEQYPRSYDGAMPICGVLGDYELFDFFVDFSLVAQTLTGVTSPYPFPADYGTAYVSAIKADLELFPGTFPFTLNEHGEHLKSFTELATGGDRPVFDQGFLFWNGVVPGDFLFGVLAGADGTMPRSPGQIIDNTDTVYQFDTDPNLTPAEQLVNDEILRVAADPSGRHPNGLANAPIVSGDIGIPVLTLHTLGDLFVPFSMEQIYADRVAHHGASDLLVQRAIRDVGHCAFTGDELAAGFLDLVTWVEQGSRPAGDDVSDPTAVSDPNFGCFFTSEDRSYPGPLSIPACP